MRRAMCQTAFAAALAVNLLIVPKVSAQAIVPTQVTTGATVEVERVIVTGSNIPTAAEDGPNPVDTYRPADIEKLGIRNAHRPDNVSATAGGRNHQPERLAGTALFNSTCAACCPRKPWC